MEKKTETLTVTIDYKATNKKGFKIAGDKDQWYTANKEIIDDLAKIEKGDKVEITFVKNGVFRNVSKIEKVKLEPKKEETKTATRFNCTDCGAELKDGKYKKCFNCNKKVKETPVEEKKEESQKTQVFDESVKEKKNWIPGNYNNPEKTAQIMRGNSLNAAGAAVSGNFAGSDPQTIAEATKIIAEQLLDWLRAE